MSDYTAPQITRLGSLSELTLTDSTGPASGGAKHLGKGSVTPDGKSGLDGNRSGG